MALGILATEPFRLKVMRLFSGPRRADCSLPRVSWGGDEGGARLGKTGPRDVTL